LLNKTTDVFDGIRSPHIIDESVFCTLFIILFSSEK